MNATAQHSDSTLVSAYDGGISSATVTKIGWTLGRHAQYTAPVLSMPSTVIM